MRILVLGASGMLGTDLVPILVEGGHEVQAPTSKDLDITDPSAVALIPAGEFGRLDWCINCAAFTAVDKAETSLREATELNAIGPGYLAKACASEGARMLHLSTDFVFDGTAHEPYEVHALTNPLGVYGKTKRDGEIAVLEAHANAVVLRTSWLYGANGNSFPKTMIKAWGAGKSLRVVADQIGSPTYTIDLARTIKDILEKNAFPGVYHATGPDAMSWYDFALQALETWRQITSQDKPIDVTPIATSEWPTPAKRPPFSVLSNAAIADLHISPMRPVKEALKDFCARLGTEQVTP